MAMPTELLGREFVVHDAPIFVPSVPEKARTIVHPSHKAELTHDQLDEVDRVIEGIKVRKDKSEDDFGLEEV